jgi:hypothetical protein
MQPILAFPCKCSLSRSTPEPRNEQHKDVYLRSHHRPNLNCRSLIHGHATIVVVQPVTTLFPLARIQKGIPSTAICACRLLRQTRYFLVHHRPEWVEQHYWSCDPRPRHAGRQSTKYETRSTADANHRLQRKDTRVAP